MSSSLRLFNIVMPSGTENAQNLVERFYNTLNLNGLKRTATDNKTVQRLKTHRQAV